MTDYHLQCINSMEHYYYPLSTRDFAFENIFSTESVSPSSYYSDRKFGFDYFPVLEEINNGQTILLYNQPPIFQDSPHTKFILRFNDTAINPNNLELLADGVFAYHGTIYFEKDNIKVLFFSAKDIRITALKAEMSLPTKTTNKYFPFFEIIDESDCKAFHVPDFQLIMSDKLIKSKIIFDKRFNHFKGFVYGLVIGHIANDRKRELSLKIRFQEIVNAFAELKSRLDELRLSKNEIEVLKKIKIYQEKLFRVINETEINYLNIKFANEVDEKLLVEYILKKTTRLKSLENTYKYLDYIIANDELLGTSNYNKIITGFVQYQSNSVPYFQELKEYIEQFINAFQSSSKSKLSAEDLNNKIKLLLRNVVEDYLNELNALTYNLRIDLNSIKYDFISNEVKFNSGRINLDTKVSDEYTLIINSILKFSKTSKGPTEKEIILKIVEDIGNSYSKGGKETLLYQYLENKIDVYSLDNASNLVTKNFVAFVFNPDSLEKLDNFLASKEIEERWMAYSFWSAYNGFSNISRNYTELIFKENNVKLQIQIDDFLKEYLKIVKGKDISFFSDEKQIEYQNNRSTTSDVKLKELALKLFQKYKLNNDKLSVEEFIEILKINDQIKFQEQLKLKYNILKKDSNRLYITIKELFDSSNLFK